MSDGIDGLNEVEIKTALDFADEYANASEQLRILQALFDQKDYLLRADINAFLSLLEVVVCSCLITNHGIQSLSDNIGCHDKSKPNEKKRTPLEISFKKVFSK